MGGRAASILLILAIIAAIVLFGCIYLASVSQPIPSTQQKVAELAATIGPTALESLRCSPGEVWTDRCVITNPECNESYAIEEQSYYDCEGAYLKNASCLEGYWIPAEYVSCDIACLHPGGSTRCLSSQCLQSCDDDNPCTVDYCDPASGSLECRHETLDGSYEGCSGFEDNYCYYKTCENGQCVREKRDVCCGDGICDPEAEDCSCVKDCGLCKEGHECIVNQQCESNICLHENCSSALTRCGDGYCDYGESCFTCQDDCGSCSSTAFCGDGRCEGDETCSNCQLDCGICDKIVGEPCLSDSECLTGTCAEGRCKVGGTYCGDGYCDFWLYGEDCTNCPSDCQGCEKIYCGNGHCDRNEDCHLCSQDCGECPAVVCGNRRCEEGEDVSACAKDCGRYNLESCSSDSECMGGYCLHDRCSSTSVMCGDSYCDSGESCTSCQSDCGECAREPYCGDGRCDPNEICYVCTSDCTCKSEGDYCERSAECASGGCVDGRCRAQVRCGDDVCSSSESCSSCPSDCGQCPVTAYCGDGTCSSDESCSSCPSDCGQCPPEGCGETNDQCYSNSDCCSGLECRTISGTGYSALKVCKPVCDDFGNTCYTNYDCCAGFCHRENSNDRTGVCTCLSTFGECESDSYCCAGHLCKDGSCCYKAGQICIDCADVCCSGRYEEGILPGAGTCK